MGKLRGIDLTPDLRSVVDATLALPQPPAADPAAREEEPRRQKRDEKNDGNSSSASIERAREARRSLSPSPSLGPEGARSVLEAAVESTKEAGGIGGGRSADDAAFLPLACVPALRRLIDDSASPPDEKAELLERLESALRRSSLSFELRASSENTDPAYRKRLERLRLHAEERSYSNLTTNLKTAASLKDDNVTVKSMMYATSVGLNMVVAPLSFGTFMYFFAGSIFSRFFDGDGVRREGDIDIRRVIAGVVSGVFMLFVEMILFVIRSHELDASVRKKGRRKENRANPFGYTQKSMARVYVRED